MLPCPYFAPRMGCPGRRPDAQKPEAEGLPAAVTHKGMRPVLRTLAGKALASGADAARGALKEAFEERIQDVRKRNRYGYKRKNR